MQIKDFLKQFQQKISPTEAELILASVLKKDKVWLYQNPQYRLLPHQYSKAKSWACRRQKGEPLAYLLRRQEFFGLDFYINKNVLIPRPETEILVEAVLTEIQKGKKTKASIVIADIGTGSGNIAITLAKKAPSFKQQIKIYAVDISEKALWVARKNARIHQIAKNLIFLRGNLLEPLPEKVDIIVANLPYVEEQFLQKKIFEPRVALNGGKEGLQLIRALLFQAPKHLSFQGKIFLEIDPRQKKKIQTLAKNIWPSSNLLFHKDLAGKERVAVIVI
jgi:release factor glutamine methyltransferase